MAIECEDQELLEGFLTETTELLEKLDDDLVALEKAASDADLLNGIFRSIPVRMPGDFDGCFTWTSAL